MKCIYCGSSCIKRGKIKEIQRYQCKRCNRFQQERYTKTVIPQEKYQWTKYLTCEGCGISSISRLLKITKSSVQRIIARLASKVKIPLPDEIHQSYEMDELRTYCKNKTSECWVMYSINKYTGKVIDLVVGRRTKENLGKVVKSVLSHSPKRIYTDKLTSYQSLIPSAVHRTFPYSTNKIERKNFTLRTHLKRVCRKTICYSRHEKMLECCLKLYGPVPLCT